LRDALIVSLFSLLPRNRTARMMGRAARSRPSRWVTSAFVRTYGVDLSEAEGTLEDYPTLEALFTRRLKPGVRPIDASADALVSPVDGRVASVGATHGGRVEVAPGRFMNVSDLVGRPVEGERDVVVVYLSPKDYHRVHMPREGRVVRWRYRPGTLWPVFPPAVRRVDGLFERNERAVAEIETDLGSLSLVMVGAFGVGRMSLAFCDLLTNVKSGPRDEAPQPPPSLGRGELFGTFHLGSTVVLVLPPGACSFNVRPGDVVRYGAKIGSFTTVSGR
jgi:phosphatidylserine decarboxylase